MNDNCNNQTARQCRPRSILNEAEDNTSDATFLLCKLWFTLLSSWKFLWLNKHRFYVWAPGKEQCAMIKLAKSLPGCQEIWVQDLPWYSRIRYGRIRVITRQVITRGDCAYLVTCMLCTCLVLITVWKPMCNSARYSPLVKNLARGTTTILQGRVEGKGSRDRLARQWLYDVKEWTGLSLNNMRREPENHVAWRKRASLVAPNGLNSLSDSRHILDTCNDTRSTNHARWHAQTGILY